MSTNGVIGFYNKATGDKWKGRYHGSDSYPTGLGRALWCHLHDHFGGDVKRMVHVLTEEHSAWSTIVNKDFKYRAGYVGYGVRREVVEAFNSNPPECYCHGARHEKTPWIWSHSDSRAEWAYVFRRHTGMMDVYWHNTSKQRYENVAGIDMAGKEPSWELIECGSLLSRCMHKRYVHDKTVCTTCDGKTFMYSSGHAEGFGSCVGRCVLVKNLPEPIKAAYMEDPHTSKARDWHVYDPRECEACKGTGKVRVSNPAPAMEVST